MYSITSSIFHRNRTTGTSIQRHFNVSRRPMRRASIVSSEAGFHAASLKPVPRLFYDSRGDRLSIHSYSFYGTRRYGGILARTKPA